MANQAGKRYICKKCGAEFIVTRGGEGKLVCCGEPMEIKKQGKGLKAGMLGSPCEMGGLFHEGSYP